MAFMQRALVAGLIIAVICPAIGLFLVLRRMAMFGDTLAHVSLAGIAAGMLTRTYPVVTGLMFSVVVSIGMDWLRQSYRRYSELSVAIALSASLALAVVLFSMARSNGGEVLAYLFGSIVTVTSFDLYLISGLGIVVFVLLVMLYKEMLSLAFDEEQSYIAGLPVRVINTGFILLTAMTIALTMRVVGALLVSSLMVVPVAAALQVASSFRSALAWSITIGVFSVLIGLLLAYEFDLAPGGMVVLTSVGILLALLGYKQARRME